MRPLLRRFEREVGYAALAAYVEAHPTGVTRWLYQQLGEPNLREFSDLMSILGPGLERCGAGHAERSAEV